MNTRRIVGLSIVATGFIWFQVAGRFEARRIDQQRESRPASQSQQSKLRIDSERLMNAVTTLAGPKFEGRAAGSPGGPGSSINTRPSAFSPCGAPTFIRSLTRA
jgi:hypothetical protein